MKYFLIILLINTIIYVSDGALSQGISHNPQYPGLCYINEQVILKPGENITLHPDCSEYTCSEGSFVTHATCGVMHAGGNCKLGDHLHPTAPYPMCCEKEIICN